MELIGRRFGHIRITDVIGQGGMGDVYAGYDEKLDRKVALKVLQTEQRLDAEARERLLREARSLSKVDSPHLCRIHDYIESSDVDLLVLEYIDGQTLADVVIERQLSRGERLRIALAITEVLVAAHRVGIIHRDLKPENVMLTKTGDVKVLDFGLARWLNVHSSASRKLRAVGSADAAGGEAGIAVDSNNTWFPVSDSSATMLVRTRDDRGKRHFRQTEAGITVGTPLYMSPEQARGEELTTASDLYSFGLLLQFLFTGLDPHPIGLTAREVILRAARGDRVPPDKTPYDVTALIAQLAQFAPADRPTAVETVARLKFLIDKPRRLARRAAIVLVALLVLVASWRYTTDLSRERTAAIAARAEAEARRAQAENLIEFMLGDLRKKLDSVGRLDILDDVGVRALAYVNSLDPATLSANDLARNAKALNHLGEVRQSQGKQAETEMFDHALRLSSEAIRREPRNPEALLAHGAAHFWLGNAFRLQGKNDDALRHMRAYMKDGDLLSEIHPQNDKYQLERAYGHAAVAMILEAKGALREALARYETSLRIKSGIAEAAPGDNDVQADLARAINKVGAVLSKLGEFRDARLHSEREVAIYRTLLARDPLQTQWKSRLATAMAYLANVRYNTGDAAGAAALWNEELAIERELTARDPTNVDWQRNYAVTLRRVADTNSDRKAALAQYAEAQSRIARLVSLYPKREYLLTDRWTIDVEYGRALLLSGAPGRAIALFRDVLAQSPATGPDRMRVLRARAAWNLADATKSEEWWQLAERELAAVTVPTEPAALELQFRVLLHRGRVAEAKQILSRIQAIGYSSAELERRV